MSGVRRLASVRPMSSGVGTEWLPAWGVSWQVVQSTDPGRALITGKWSDIGKFKGPTLRALAPRAPYFHNGSAKDLNEVVDFYNTRFGIGFTDQEREDLVAFLKAL